MDAFCTSIGGMTTEKILSWLCCNFFLGASCAIGITHSPRRRRQFKTMEPEYGMEHGESQYYFTECSVFLDVVLMPLPQVTVNIIITFLDRFHEFFS